MSFVGCRVGENLYGRALLLSPSFSFQSVWVMVDKTKVNSDEKAAGKAGKSGMAPKLWTFPKRSNLEEAIKIPKAIEEKHGGNPMKADILAKAVGFRQPQDWRFLDLLRSANQYGLVKGTGANAIVSLEKIGQDVVAPSSPTQRQQALLAAFRKVADFKKVEDYYRGKKIPEDEYFLNTLTREFGIQRDRVERFAEVFQKSLDFLGQFNAPVEAQPPESHQLDGGVAQETILSPEIVDLAGQPTRVRQFLDTCFVMMPFGSWFDRYYQEIYAPAIREAGFEPVRADELFSTGSVVEQIWEQIEKAIVLLADLTDKNPNVFYELGLAHAARKPVVFSAGKLEDVPFDLRHLRVIVYDVREPTWAEKLRRNIADYLRNAKSEPEKSIPQPFRGQEGEEEAVS